MLIEKTITGNAAIIFFFDDDDATLLQHTRLDHVSQMNVELYNKNVLKGIKCCRLNFCKTYILDKQYRAKFVTLIKRSTQVLDYIYLDIWRVAPITSQRGARYFNTFTNEFFRKIWIYFLKHKPEVFVKFKS